MEDDEGKCQPTDQKHAIVPSIVLHDDLIVDPTTEHSRRVFSQASLLIVGLLPVWGSSQSPPGGKVLSYLVAFESVIDRLEHNL